jgi:uncharacterized protein with PQ loop repeat
VDQATAAELAALVATLLATVGALPQLHRIVRRGDRRGVSLTSAALGIGTETAWFGYATIADLWSALPEAALMGLSNTVLAVVLIRRGAPASVAVCATVGWLAALGAVAVLGGAAGVGLVLGVAYAVQVAPAVWTAWRTPVPTGVAAATWAMVGVEGILWGAYGLHHADPAMLTFAGTATFAAAAMLVRKAITTA